MGRKARSIFAHSQGLESKKKSGGGGSVFLDFPFYRTYQDVADLRIAGSRLIGNFSTNVQLSDDSISSGANFGVGDDAPEIRCIFGYSFDTEMDAPT
jgi:hypothetical protein